MPERAFTVNVYRVATKDDEDGDQLRLEIDSSLSDAIDTAYTASVDDRISVLNQKKHRLEHWERRQDCYLINFVTGAFDGPGSFSQTKEVKHFGLQEDEDFAYETAMLYDPENHYVFLEFSQRGMRSTTITRYFQKFMLSDKCILIPVVDEDAPDRARKFKTIRGLSLKAYLPEFSHEDREAGVSAIQGVGDGFGAEIIDIRLESRRDGSLNLTKIWATIDDLRSQLDGLDILRVTGREDPWDDYSPIDLIQHREKRTHQLIIDDIERKVPYGDRWDALMKTRKEFLP